MVGDGRNGPLREVRLDVADQCGDARRPRLALLARQAPSSDRTTLIRFVQDAIDKGATTVEEIHKSLADLPPKILGESELLREPAKEAKRLQIHTLSAIYGAVRDINEQVATYASELLEEAAQRRAPRKEGAK